MAQWYHRNALKSTAPHKFTLALSTAHPTSIQICSALSKSRTQILELVRDPSSDSVAIHQELINYLSLLQAFIFCHDLDKNFSSTHSSKLRHMTVYKWSNSTTGTVEKQQDAAFELISICYEYALWLMKHASWIASQDKVDMDSAKTVHTSLRKAAGVFSCIQTQWLDQLLEKPTPTSDLDSRVLTAYIVTCQAEAQEVTIARAMELKHSASLISALANQTSQLFLKADASVKSVDSKHYAKWQVYLQMKAEVYKSYAFCFLGEHLLEQEKCGEAIRALDESEKHFTNATKICNSYGQIKMVVKNGISAKIDQHLFFRNLRPLVQRVKEKCTRENGFIYHQKVPEECPQLEMKATHGLVTPEEFDIPGLHELWTPSAYASFEIGLEAKKKKSDGKDYPVEEIKEIPIKSSVDQKNESGCSIQ